MRFETLSRNFQNCHLFLRHYLCVRSWYEAYKNKTSELDNVPEFVFLFANNLNTCNIRT